MSIHVDRRHELAAGLRALREERQLSTHQLAERLGWSQSKVSRVDRGATLAKPAEVVDWVDALSGSAELRRHLVELAEQAGIQLTEWRRELAPGRRRVQAEIGRKELAASVLRFFGFDVVPGLAQTPAYAEVMFKLGQPVTDDEDTEAAIAARLTRQDVLSNPDKTFKLLCTEAAFHRSLLGRSDMLEQIDRVLDVAALPNVDFRVIPFSAKERTHTSLAFAVLGDPACDEDAIVLAELPTRGFTARAPEEIARWIEHYELLAAAGVTGDDLVRLLREVAVAAPWS